MSIYRNTLIAALCLVGTATQADDVIKCGVPTVIVGDTNPGPDPVVGINIYKHDFWEVIHTRRSGANSSRQEQYNLADTSASYRIQWTGVSKRMPWLTMIGEIKKDKHGQPWYMEWQYDKRIGNQLVFHMMASCKRYASPHEPEVIEQPTMSVKPTAAPAPATPVTPKLQDRLPASPATPAKTARTSVPIHPAMEGRAAKVDVIIGGQPLRMLIDTGATMCLISQDLAVKIVREGNGQWQTPASFTMADGSQRSMRVLLVNSLVIGPHTLKAVRVGVSTGPDPILGFPVLNDIGRFMIDTRARELIFNG